LAIIIQDLKLKIKLSSAYHPQTDRQTERVNQVLEQYLHCTINYHQDNWTELLPLVELAYNTIQGSIQQIPFFAKYGYHPKFDQFDFNKVENPVVGDLTTRLSEIHTKMKNKLLEAQDRQKDNTDKSQKVHHVINIGDKIWLLRRNLKTNRPCDKLDFHLLGPFLVIKQINDVAFRLELSPLMNIHSVFHVSFLEPYKESSIPDRFQVPPLPVEIERQKEFEVSEILDSRIIWRKLEYLVQWQGYNISERTWEPVTNLRHAPEMLQEFHQWYPEKPSSKDA
jgi:hypothetical protein